MLKASITENLIEAGCDEAGRGCLAGPVVAAAVILPRGYRNDLLNDSKMLDRAVREKLRKQIEHDAVAYAIGISDNNEIDRVNILNASFKAMHRAVDMLQKRPELLLIDGNRFHAYPGIRHECIIKGDGKLLSIAAASIIAKTYRDALMTDMSRKHPQYGWDHNFGYPTNFHREAIRQYGLTVYHRRSFRQLPEQLDLFSEG
jgi:ribonuclease HII